MKLESQLQVSTASGVAPFTVNQAALVSNLNAQYLGGQLGSYFEGRDTTAIGFSGGSITLTRTAGNISVSLDGRYLPLTGGTLTGGLTGTTGSFSGQITSTVATGTAPLVIASTTLVSNLNAQYLNGQLGGYYAAASSLASYLPLAGGTLTGALYLTDATNGISKAGGRFTIRSESTDDVANFASYGLYLPKSGQAAGLYVESPIEARGGIRIGTSAVSGTITVGADTAATANRLVQRDGSGGVAAVSFSGLGTGLTGTATSLSIGGNAATATSSPLLSALASYIWDASTLPNGFNLGIQSSFVQGANGWPSYGSIVNVRAYSGGGSALQMYVPYSPSYGGTGMQVRFGNYDVSSGNSWTAWKTLLASDNYSSYALPLSGGTLTGGITATNFTGPGTGLTGNATSLTAGAVPWSGITSKPTTLSGFGITDALPLAGGTLTGQLNIEYTNARQIIKDGTNTLVMGHWDTVNVRIEAAGRPLYMVSYGGAISIGRSSGSNLVVDTASVSYGGNQVLHAGNYGAYSAFSGAVSGASLSISGTSSLNRINLNAAANAYIQYRAPGQGTVNANFPFYLNAAYGSINIEVADNDTGGLMIDNEGVTVYGAGDGTTVFRVIDEDVYQSTTNIISSRTFWINEGLNGGGGILGQFTISGNVAIHAGNYTSYPDATKLPLTGGALTGTVSISTTSSGAGNRAVVIKNSGQSIYDFGSYAGAWRSSLQIQSNSSDRLLFFAPPETGYEYGIIRSANGGLNIDVGGTLTTTGTTGIRIEASGAVSMPGTLNVVGAITQNGNQVLHAGNYNSYALPLSGGTLASTNDQILNLNKSSGTGWGYIGFSQAGTRRFYFGLNASFEPELGVDNGGTFRVNGGMTVGGNAVLTTGNYTSYALPLAGGTLTGALNGTTASFSGVVDATQFRDSNDVAYFLDPAGTSNLNQWTTLTAARLGRSRYWTNRLVHTGDSNYHTGTNGWDTSQGTWANAWKGGFSGWDIWGSSSDHPQGAGYIHAQGIVSGLHTSATDGSSAHGWMMVGAHGATDNRYWLRGKWGASISGWVEMLTTGNASYAYNMNQNVGTGNSPSFTGLSVINTITGAVSGSSGSCTGNAASASSLAADTSTRFKILTFTGVGGDSGNGAVPDSYAIYQQGGSWTHPYPDLCIGYHTGIKIGAYYGYGGTRFYNNSDWATEIFSVGNGDNNVRVVNTIYAAAFSGPLTGNVTGDVTGSAGSCSGSSAQLNGQAASYYQNAGNLNAGTLLAARLPAFTGDVTSTAGTVGLTLASIATAGTYNSVTIDAKGRVTAGTNVPVFYSTGGTLTGSIVVQGGTNSVLGSENGNASQWYGRVGSVNGTSDRYVFMGTYGSFGAIRCQVNSTGAAADLYINTVDGSTGGTVRMPSSVLINGSQALHAGNFSSYALPLAGNAASASAVAASGITGQTGMWTSAARPGPYRLYRRDADDAYSVQNYWTGSYWRLDGYYSNNTVHAGCSVSYADAAGSSASCSGNAASVTDGVYLSTNQYISGVKTFSAAPVAENIAKAWVHYNMNNNTINASYNVSSVTDNGTGVCTVNFSTAMVDANYVVAGTATYGYDDQDIHALILAVPRRSTAQQAGSCRLATEYIHAAGVYDSVAVRAVFYR